MKRPRGRSTGVSTATATTRATEAPERARVAFETLYRESRDDLYAYVAGLLRNHAAAEEVTSQAFERAWRKRRQLNPERGTPRTWLFGIARNAALDELRRRSRVAGMPVEPTASEADPAGLAAGRADVQRALGSLNDRERELIALKYFAGLSNVEIAAVTGTSESNAGTRVHRVLEKLRRTLDAAD